MSNGLSPSWRALWVTVGCEALHGMKQAAGVRYRTLGVHVDRMVPGSTVLVRYADLCRAPDYAERGGEGAGQRCCGCWVFGISRLVIWWFLRLGGGEWTLQTGEDHGCRWIGSPHGDRADGAV